MLPEIARPVAAAVESGGSATAAVAAVEAETNRNLRTVSHLQLRAKSY